MGRDTGGVVGVDLSPGAKVVSLLRLEPGTDVLTICASTTNEPARRPTEIKPGDNVTVLTLTKLPRK